MIPHPHLLSFPIIKVNSLVTLSTHKVRGTVGEKNGWAVSEEDVISQPSPPQVSFFVLQFQMRSLDKNSVS